MTLNIKIIRTFDEAMELRKPWRELHELSPNKCFFGQPEWHLGWMKTLGANKKVEYYIISVWEGKELIGIAPLMLGVSSWSSLRVKKIEFITGIFSDYHDFIIKEGKETQILLLLFDIIFRKLINKASILEFCHFRENSNSCSLLEQYLKTNGFRYEIQKDVSPLKRLSLNISEIEKSFHQKHRMDIKRQIRRLREMGDLTLKVFQDNDEIIDCLPDFFDTHSEKWGAYGYPKVFLNELFRRHYLEIVNSIGIARGMHFSALMLNGKAISYHFGFLYDGRFYYYRPAFKIDYAKYSPAKVHIYLLMELGAKENWNYFDFLIGDEQYKYLWGVEEVPLSTFIIKGKGLKAWPAYYWLIRGRRFVNEHLPKQLLQKIRSVYIENKEVY